MWTEKYSISVNPDCVGPAHLLKLIYGQFEMFHDR